MLIPLDHIGLAISFIHGPMVNDWVEHMMNRIDQHLAQGVNPNDEWLWATFTHAFQQSFTNTMKVQNAHQKLMHVKMKGDTLDDHIVKFQHLRALAGWGEDNAGTLMLFKQNTSPPHHSEWVGRCHAKAAHPLGRSQSQPERRHIQQTSWC